MGCGETSWHRGSLPLDISLSAAFSDLSRLKLRSNRILGRVCYQQVVAESGGLIGPVVSTTSCEQEIGVNSDYFKSLDPK